MLIFAAALFFQTIGGDEDVMLFARLVSLISFLCGGFICVMVLKGEKSQTVFDRALLFDIAFPALIFLICMLNVRLGFYTSMFVICMVTIGGLLWNQNLKPAEYFLKVFFESLLITAGMYLAFHIILGVITPAGVFI